VENPDFTEDYFEMVHRYLKKCPDIVFSSDILPQIFQCGLFGLGVFHREAISAVMNFYGTLITYGINNPRENSLRNSKPSEEHVKILTKLFQQYGQQLVSGLVAGISGALPHSRIHYLVNVVKAILGFCEMKAQVFFVVAIKGVQNKVPDSLKEEFIRNLFKPQEFKLKDLVIAYAEKCREYRS